MLLQNRLEYVRLLLIVDYAGLDCFTAIFCVYQLVLSDLEQAIGSLSGSGQTFLGRSRKSAYCLSAQAYEHAFWMTVSRSDRWSEILRRG
jgi:hypothetical protein